MKPDEAALMRAVAGGERPRDAVGRLGMPRNRALYLLERKWPGKGWYDYGVTCDLGWLTDSGKAVAATL